VGDVVLVDILEGFPGKGLDMFEATLFGLTPK
jgi:hypothetical protein